MMNLQSFKTELRRTSCNEWNNVIAEYTNAEPVTPGESAEIKQALDEIREEIIGKYMEVGMDRLEATLMNYFDFVL